MASGFEANRSYLGYVYQARLALLQLFDLTDETGVLIEKDDDVVFISETGEKSLQSLKHKAEGDSLTNQGRDFWKSVRIWLAHYLANGKVLSSEVYLLFTTALVSSDSFLTKYTITGYSSSRVEEFYNVLCAGTTELNSLIKIEFDKLGQDEKEDFLRRITIHDSCLTIADIPQKVKTKYLRAIRTQHRDSAFERLEGWWNDQVIKLLTRERVEPIWGYELSNMVHQIAYVLADDNLPIDFSRSQPDKSEEYKHFVFIHQLRALGISEARVQEAILDFYRAFMQRAVWAREQLLRANEIEEFEERLIDEWSRFKNALLDDIRLDGDEALVRAGRDIYNWANFKTSHLRIRDRVTEGYVTRGSYHILANEIQPKVYWHPQFLEKLKYILEVGSR